MLLYLGNWAPGALIWGVVIYERVIICRLIFSLIPRHLPNGLALLFCTLCDWKAEEEPEAEYKQISLQAFIVWVHVYKWSIKVLLAAIRSELGSHVSQQPEIKEKFGWVS